MLLVALPSLMLPLGHDQSLFYVSGQRILNGAVMYRDIIDIKPPLIYHLYALAGLLQWNGADIRLLDLIVQAMTCLLIVRLLRHLGAGDFTAALAAFLYTALYYSQGFGDLAQSEAFTGLFGTITAWCILKQRSPRAAIIAGLAIGALMLMKFTLAGLLPVAALVIALRHDVTRSRRLASLLGLVGGFSIAVALLAAYITLGNAWHQFAQVMEFTRAYGAIELASPTTWARNLATLLPQHLAQDYTLVLLLPTCTAIIAALGWWPSAPHTGPIEPPTDVRTQTSPLNELMRFCTMAFLAMIATVVIEGKYPSYHFIRIMPFGAILAAAGITHTLAWLARHHVWHGYTRLLAPLLLACALLFGPLPGYTWHTLMMVYERLDILQDPDHIDVEDNKRVVYPTGMFGGFNRLWKARNDSDLFVLSSQAGMLYLYNRNVPVIPIYHSAFIIAPFAPVEWRRLVQTHLLSTRPAFIVADLGDSLSGITGSTLTSENALTALPGVDTMLTHSYRRTELPVRFLPHNTSLRLAVYERNSSNGTAQLRTSKR